MSKKEYLFICEFCRHKQTYIGTCENGCSVFTMPTSPLIFQFTNMKGKGMLRTVGFKGSLVEQIEIEKGKE
jgi:hypothetical protein